MIYPIILSVIFSLFVGIIYFLFNYQKTKSKRFQEKITQLETGMDSLRLTNSQLALQNEVLAKQNISSSQKIRDLVKKVSTLESNNEKLDSNVNSYNQQINRYHHYYQQAIDLKSKLQNLCEFGPTNCKIETVEHIKNHHPEKIDFTTDDWYLHEPENSSSALKSVIEEEFDDLSNFACFICYEISSGDNYQLTCCSQYICVGCYNENCQHNGSGICPHCKSPRVQVVKISKLKSDLNDVRDTLVRNVMSKMGENGGGGATVQTIGDSNHRVSDAGVRTCQIRQPSDETGGTIGPILDKINIIFAWAFPEGTEVEHIVALPVFRTAVNVTLPWNRDGQLFHRSVHKHQQSESDYQKRNRVWAFIEFSNEQDCLNALSASKNLVFRGAVISTSQLKLCV